jgi:hypothetical protein
MESRFPVCAMTSYLEGRIAPSTTILFIVTSSLSSTSGAEASTLGRRAILREDRTYNKKVRNKSREAVLCTVRAPVFGLDQS